MNRPGPLRAAVAVWLLLAAWGAAQSGKTSGLKPAPPLIEAPAAQTDPSGAPILAPAPEQRKLQRIMAERRNKQRQKKIQSDAQRLLQLASDLQTAVKTSQESALTAGEVKQLDEIEKLARDVKRNMTGEN